jgi:hypothetical protein
MTGGDALKQFAQHLTEYEKKELQDYSTVYYFN